MISFSQYETYFRDIATSYALIEHTDEAPRFSTLDIDDILSAQRGALDFTKYCMILENPSGGMGYKHDRMLDMNYGAFYILHHVNRNNPAEKRTIMDTAKAMGAEILAKIQLDKEKKFKGDLTAPRLLNYFDLNEVKYQKVGPIFSDCYGWRFEVDFGEETPLALVYTPTNWT